MSGYAIYQTRPRRFLNFPYMVFYGTYPHGKIIGVAQTRWGARRKLNRAQRKQFERFTPPRLIEKA